MYKLTQKQARRALLSHQGLWPPRQGTGEAGVLDHLSRIGSVQFDPVDVAGISPQIVLNARINNFTAGMLDALLYEKRLLMDVWDKNACIAATAEYSLLLGSQMGQDMGWRTRMHNVGDLDEATRRVMERMATEGPLSSREFADDPHGKEAMLRLVNEGLISIHHREGRRRFFHRSDHLFSQEVYTPAAWREEERIDWLILRRIGAIGLLWNRASDAWLGICGMNGQARQEGFKRLIDSGKIVPVQVEGISAPLYCRKEDWPRMEAAALADRSPASRCSFIAPLDNFIWDRKLIKQLFGFAYRWEVYTPADQRIHGPYTLPVLYGDRFIARVQLTRKQGALHVESWWWEEGITANAAMLSAIEKALLAHGKMLGLAPGEWSIMDRFPA